MELRSNQEYTCAGREGDVKVVGTTGLTLEGK